MSLRQQITAFGQACFPRVSGDEPAGAQAIRDGAEFSPRERG